VGFPQLRPQCAVEPPLVTVGDDFSLLAQFLPPGSDSYSANDVLRKLLPPTEASSSPVIAL
jgi:hypothetical protein